MTRVFWVDMLERVLWTFIQAFCAAWIVFGSFDKKAFMAGAIGGAIAVAKALIAANIGNRNSASTAPSVGITSQ